MTAEFKTVKRESSYWEGMNHGWKKNFKSLLSRTYFVSPVYCLGWASARADHAASSILHVQPGIPGGWAGRAVHGHLDGYADFVVMGLWGRIDLDLAEPEPCLCDLGRENG